MLHYVSGGDEDVEDRLAAGALGEGFRQGLRDMHLRFGCKLKS